MSRFVRSVAVTLGFALVFLGGAKLNGLGEATAPLGRLGVPPGMFPLVGAAEIALGLLLTQGHLHRAGGWLTSAWMLTAVATHLTAGDVVGAGLPLALATFGFVLARRAPALALPVRGPAPLRALPGPGLPRLAFTLRHVGVSFLIRWAVGGLLFWAALPFLALSHARAVGATATRQRLELVLLYLLFYGYGAGGIWNFTGHFFASDMVAASVGWAAGSPFQQELAFYALGTGTVGLLTPWVRDRFWVAAALTPSIFVYGAAYTHVEDYLRTGNDAPMNWSFSAVGANILIPTLILALTWAYARHGGFREAATPEGFADRATSEHLSTGSR